MADALLAWSGSIGVAAGGRAAAGAPPALAAAASPAGALSISRAGQWLIDGQGRVVVVHGVNLVHKTAPFYPDTFTAQDAQFLANEGFTVARIGFIWQAVEPQPGVYDDAYVQHVVDLDHLLAQYGIRTLVDFHQDFWSIGSADGAPAWATLGTNALDDFQAFWDNDPAPDGAGSRPTSTGPGRTSPAISAATPTSSASTRLTNRSRAPVPGARSTRRARSSRPPSWPASTAG